MQTVKVGIIGATGYAGVELIRLLLGHPKAKITALCSVSFEGKPISEIYPALYQINDDILTLSIRSRKSPGTRSSPLR